MNEGNDKLKVAKKLTIVGASMGVAYVVTQAVKFVCPAGGTLLEKAGALVGGGILSAWIADGASKYAEEKIDEAVKKFEESVTVEITLEEEEVAEA